jgi:hypothetical protein
VVDASQHVPEQVALVPVLISVGDDGVIGDSERPELWGVGKARCRRHTVQDGDEPVQAANIDAASSLQLGTK